jgi:hypothetical protein
MNNSGWFCDITIQLFSRNVSFKSSSFRTRNWFKDNLIMNKMWVLMRDVLPVRTAGPKMWISAWSIPSHVFFKNGRMEVCVIFGVVVGWNADQYWLYWYLLMLLLLLILVEGHSVYPTCSLLFTAPLHITILSLIIPESRSI